MRCQSLSTQHMASGPFSTPGLHTVKHNASARFMKNVIGMEMQVAHLVLGGPELARSLGLLLQRLLLLRVCVANLHLQIFTGRLDGVVVERPDDFLAVITGLKSGEKGQPCQCTMSVHLGPSHRAKPTPRP